MRDYKLVLLFKSDLKKEQKQKLMDEIQKWVGDVKVKKTNEMGERKLAYSIKGAKSADYVVLELEGEKVATDAEIRIGRQDEIIRHLMVRVD